MVCVHYMDFVDILPACRKLNVLYSIFLYSTPVSSSPVLTTETVVKSKLR